MATSKQVDFISDLLDRKDLFASPRFFDAVNAMDAEELAAYIERMKEQVKTASVERASEIISSLLDLPNKSAKRRENGNSNPQPDVGMYRCDNGDIVRVYFGQQSGQNLAKKLVDTGVPYPKDSRGVAASGTIHEWEYMGLAARFVSPKTTKLTLEEAKEYGHMSGTCCRCGRRLDVPESVEAGIGPVCAGKVGEWA